MSIECFLITLSISCDLFSTLRTFWKNIFRSSGSGSDKVELVDIRDWVRVKSSSGFECVAFGNDCVG